MHCCRLLQYPRNVANSQLDDRYPLTAYNPVSPYDVDQVALNLRKRSQNRRLCSTGSILMTNPFTIYQINTDLHPTCACIMLEVPTQAAT